MGSAIAYLYPPKFQKCRVRGWHYPLALSHRGLAVRESRLQNPPFLDTENHVLSGLRNGQAGAVMASAYQFSRVESALKSRDHISRDWDAEWTNCVRSDGYGSKSCEIRRATREKLCFIPIMIRTRRSASLSERDDVLVRQSLEWPKLLGRNSCTIQVAFIKNVSQSVDVHGGKGCTGYIRHEQSTEHRRDAIGTVNSSYLVCFFCFV